MRLEWAQSVLNFVQNITAWKPSKNPKLLLAMLISLIFCALFLQEIFRCFQPSKKMLALATPNKSVQPKEELNLGAPLFTMAWFGQYMPVNITETTIKKSKLDAKLMGIVFAPDASHSQVIIKEEENDEKIYAVGDALSRGAVVKRILPTKVIILHEGALESLSLPRDKLEVIAPSSPLQQEP